MEISLSFGNPDRAKPARRASSRTPVAAGALALVVLSLALASGVAQRWTPQEQARTIPTCAQAVQGLSSTSMIALLTGGSDQAGKACSFQRGDHG
jgi:hypothetical protein